MYIEDLIIRYSELGYSFSDAVSKVCQDIILFKISKSNFKNNVTIKGGVVIHNISLNKRRATRDLDLDFIKYSLDDLSIINFINILSSVDDVKVEIIGTIKQLHHQDYDGKRVFIRLTDSQNYSIETKLDIGVHKLFELEQDEYCFDLNVIDKNVNLLINSKEQIFTEKLKSLLKLGVRSTRYKDLFDFYYLINIATLDEKKLLNDMSILIFSDETMRESNVVDVIRRLEDILNSRIYRNHLNNPKVNWLDLPIELVIDNVLEYIGNLSVMINS